MRQHPLTALSNRQQQTGASLLVALIIVVVLTIAGLSSMNTAVMELKMAGSLQQQSIALNRAEETLILSEQRILTLVNDGNEYDFSDTGIYSSTDASINVRNRDWSAIAAVTPVSGVKDSYVIKYMGEKVPIGGSRAYNPKDPITGDIAHTFQNTSRSEAGKNSVRILQSTFVTLTKP